MGNNEATLNKVTFLFISFFDQNQPMNYVQSTTSFLVVDKLSVILVKQPKIR